MSIEAMKLALEALEGVISAHGYQGGTPVKAVTALRQAIEQAEPGAWNPLYTTPPLRKPLTDEEIMNVFICSGRDEKSFARAIEAAHGITGENK